MFSGAVRAHVLESSHEFPFQERNYGLLIRKVVDARHVEQ